MDILEEPIQEEPQGRGKGRKLYYPPELVAALTRVHNKPGTSFCIATGAFEANGSSSKEVHKLADTLRKAKPRFDVVEGEKWVFSTRSYGGLTRLYAQYNLPEGQASMCSHCGHPSRVHSGNAAICTVKDCYCGG